jgi:hypothetical protein
LIDDGYGCRVYNPDGGKWTLGAPFFHETGAENGISDLGSPINALVGLFLSDESPDTTPAPDPLDFNSAESRNYLVLTPALKQVFFIGDGLTAEGIVQQIVIPERATRLFLGTMDGCCWNNNSGLFTVEITSESDLIGRAIPEPAALPIVGALLALMIWLRAAKGPL